MAAGSSFDDRDPRPRRGGRASGRTERSTGRSRAGRAARPAWIRALRLALAIATLGVFAAIALLVGIFTYYGSDPKLANLSRLDAYRPKQVTRILDRNGVSIGELGSEKRTVVPYAAIPKVLVQAVVAAEDADYFQHGGLDYRGMLRAFIEDVLRGRTRARRIDHHPAGGQDAAPVAGADHAPQGAGDHPRPAAVAEAVEGGRPLPLPQPDLLRPWPLRLRGGGALLLRQVGAGHRARRGGAARRPAPESGAALAPQAPGRGQDAAALRARPDGGARLHRPRHRRPGRGPADPPGAGADVGAGPRRGSCRQRRAVPGRATGRAGGVRGGHDGGDHDRRQAAGAGARRRSSAGSRISTRARVSGAPPGT